VLKEIKIYRTTIKVMMMVHRETTRCDEGILQYTATHWNTLQHAATHCNTHGMQAKGTEVLMVYRGGGYGI